MVDLREILEDIEIRVRVKITMLLDKLYNITYLLFSAF